MYLLFPSPGASPNFAAATTLVIWLVLALPPTLFIIVGLSLADQTTAIEGGAGVWGFAALRRSWALSKGSRAAILAVILLSALVSIVLGSPLEILVNNFQDGSAFAGTWWQVLLAILGAVVVFLLSVFIQAYLQVSNRGRYAYFLDCPSHLMASKALVLWFCCRFQLGFFEFVEVHSIFLPLVSFWYFAESKFSHPS